MNYTIVSIGRALSINISHEQITQGSTSENYKHITAVVKPTLSLSVAKGRGKMTSKNTEKTTELTDQC